MECKDSNDLGSSKQTEEDALSIAAVNSTILNYYKKFGRKRDLEQYFSLSTANSDIRDPKSFFWSRMKQQNDSSDSGEKRTDSSTELCRISIRCTVPEPSTSQDEKEKRTPDSDSPPIITEDVDNASKHSDEEVKSDDEVKTDDEQSQKSADATFDTSMNKPLSPTSSVTSHRRLEWDSLADVGYYNESGRKTSVQSNLSTLERLALKQQYSNNDSKELGLPTAHSTPLDQNEDKKPRRPTNKTTRIQRKDVDLIEVNMPHSSNMLPPQAINVNLTKHISFNVDNSGGVITVEDKKIENKIESNDSTVPSIKMDRDSQTSLKKTSDKGLITEVHTPAIEQITVPLSLNTLRRRNRKKRALRRKSNTRVKSRANKENEPVIQKNVDQVSEAESFEYMPGHIYNQNQQRMDETKTSSATVGNKSSLESSGNVTTDSSKHTKLSFSRDLEKSCKLLKEVLKGHCDDKDLKRKLVKSVVQRLLDSKYKDDESSTDFLSGLSYNSRKLGVTHSHHTTTSTSDNTEEKPKVPKKSILRVDKFDPNNIASSSQSAPNLPIVTNQDIPVLCSLGKANLTTTTESDSGKEKYQLSTTKESSEELYQKYLQALEREAAYKKHLREKDNLLRQKLVGSDISLKPEARMHNRIKELMKDLTRNNYDDGSGDASKLEGGSNSYPNVEEHGISKDQRSHSVFTLNSSGASGSLKQKWNLKRRLKHEMKHSDDGNKGQSCTSASKGIYYKVEVSESSVQVDLQGSEENDEVPAMEPIIESTKNIAHIVSDEATGDVKYVCLCPSDTKNSKTLPENILIYKCSRLSNAQQPSSAFEGGYSNEEELKITEFSQPSTSNNCDEVNSKVEEKSSQTDFHCTLMPPLGQKPEPEKSESVRLMQPNNVAIEEATRCLQTEITINPTLVEPTISDVHFVKDEDCAVLISEQYKIPKALTELICEDDSKQSLTGTSKSGIRKYLQQEQQSYDDLSNFTQPSGNKNDAGQVYTESHGLDSVDTKSDNVRAHPVCYKDNIAIPIEGTNMTLMVTFSADARPEMAVHSQGTITHKPEVSEKTTSIFEECTKSVQSQNTNLFKKIDNIMVPTQPKQDTVSSEIENTTEKYNTHPKDALINEKKPYFRSNTDPALACSTPPINRFEYKNAVDASNIYPIVVKHKRSTYRGSQDDDINWAKPKHASDSSKEYETQYSSRCATPLITGSNDTSSYHLLKKSEAPGYLKMFTRKSPQKPLTVKSPKRSYKKKKPKSKESLDELREPILDMIKAITKRFSKSSMEQGERKRLKDIVSALSYLLDTDESENVINTSGSQSRSGTRNTSINTSDANLPKNNEHVGKVHSDCKLVMSDLQMDINKEKQIKVVKPNEDHDESTWTGSKYCTTMKNIGMPMPEDTNYNNDMAPVSLFGNNQYAGSNSDCNMFNASEKNSKKPPKGTDSHFLVSDKPKRTNRFYDIMGEVAKYPIGEELIVKIRCKKKRKPKRERESRADTLPQEKDIVPQEKDMVPQEKDTVPKEKDTVPKEKDTVPKEKDTVPCSVTSKPRNTCNYDICQPGPSGINLRSCKTRNNKYSTDDGNTVSTDSATLNTLTSIQKDSDKYRQNTTSTSHPACSDPSSTCNVCNRVHSKGHKYKKTAESIKKKKSIAYNLILQASDSISEDTVSDRHTKQLKNIVIKVPSRRKQLINLPFNELSAKIEKKSHQFLSYEEIKPDMKHKTDVSSFGSKHTDVFTVRRYLEKNRPEFVDKSTKRQNCIKLISEKRASQREAQRRLLSLHVDNREAMSNLNLEQLRMLAEELGIDYKKKDKPKFIRENEMKKHSERIYKTLPEVTQKKEQQKKDNIKKTNLLMADIFRKNLQKRTLQGNVNLSNYSAVLKL